MYKTARVISFSGTETVSRVSERVSPQAFMSNCAFKRPKRIYKKKRAKCSQEQQNSLGVVTLSFKYELTKKKKY